MTRREFLKGSAAAAGGLLSASDGGGAAREETPFAISLAEWSFHRMLRAGTLEHRHVPKLARDRYGLDAVEYVSTFFTGRGSDHAEVADLARRAADLGVRSLLIMVDREGDLGDPGEPARAAAVENHRKWLDAARALGCHSIRVNAASRGTPDEQRRLAADGLARLADLAGPLRLNVIVENHGGLSSNGAWLASVIRAADRPNLGTLPDFGNFNLGDGTWYDRYQGVKELMPFAKAVSAKSNDFDAAGNETGTDYRRMLRIVLDAGYRGYVGIEYEGERLPEEEGVAATQRLLERVRSELALQSLP
jgi:sugar phosphate isomerase/epimerase